MVVADGQGVPLGVELASASPHEVTLIEPLLAQISVPRNGAGRPRSRFPRLIYDRAADSDPLRDRLAKRGIDLICPHRKNRKKPKRQDGRKLRRYKRRYRIERTIGWLSSFRRLVTRYERKSSIDSEIVQAIQQATKQKDKASAVHMALNEYLRLQKLRQLADLAGTVELRYSNDELEAM